MNSARKTSKGCASRFVYAITKYTNEKTSRRRNHKVSVSLEAVSEYPRRCIDEHEYRSDRGDCVVHRRHIVDRPPAGRDREIEESHRRHVRGNPRGSGERSG